jgi:hypothetical protein
MKFFTTAILAVLAFTSQALKMNPHDQALPSPTPTNPNGVTVVPPATNPTTQPTVQPTPTPAPTTVEPTPVQPAPAKPAETKPAETKPADGQAPPAKPSQAWGDADEK